MLMSTWYILPESCDNIKNLDEIIWIRTQVINHSNDTSKENGKLYFAF